MQTKNLIIHINTDLNKLNLPFNNFKLHIILVYDTFKSLY